MSHPQHAPTWVGFKRSTVRQPNCVIRTDGESSWLIEYTVAGKAVVYSPKGEELIFSKGDFFCYRSQTPQRYELKKGQTRWHHYWADFVPPEPWLQMLNWKEHFPGFQSLSITEKALQKRIEWLFCQGKLASTSHHYSHRHILVMNIIEQILLWAGMGNPCNLNKSIDGRIRAILKYIDSSMESPMELKYLGQKVGLSAFRFAHLFRKNIGISPMRYVEQKRMERATELLRSTSEPVASIARQVGYDDPFHFSRVVYRATGFSPINYRKEVARKTS